jgi:hypothetical protein
LKTHCIRFAFILILLVAWASCTRTGKLSPAPYLAARQTGYFENLSIRESSGLTASCHQPGVLWTLNDSGSPPLLYAVGPEGRDLGTVRVKGAVNRDWEDLASFRVDQTAYLLIADVGDNRARYGTYTLYLVKEPSLKTPLPPDATVPIFRRINFVYPDGARDCEAVAVDTQNRRVLLLSKRTQPPHLYSLPLAPKSAGRITARRLGPVPKIPGPTLSDQAFHGEYASQPTAMDIAPDGRSAVVLTYKSAYLFPKAPQEPWSKALSRTPQRIPIPLLRQAEGICFGYDGKTLFLSSEGHPGPLLRVEARSPSKGK